MEEDNPSNHIYQCENCGQTVQGWHAQDAVECCDDKKMKFLAASRFEL